MSLKTPSVPRGIEVMKPYSDPYIYCLCEKFYQKFYNDHHKRIVLLGINPGRFGSGSTGVSFTDPIKLEVNCGIKNNLIKKPELSADFIYLMIDAYGGPQKFYSKYFISAVSPLGFTKNGKNINYYNERNLEKAIAPFIVDSISRLVSFGIERKKSFCIGEGKNFEFLSQLNEIHGWFGEIVPLPHPRFIMQYRRKKLGQYIETYLKRLT